MNFCSRCGAPVAHRVPAGDDRPRHVCDTCGSVHYQNPRIIAGCIPVWDDLVLMCRRAIEPRHGLWTLPAGFMENGETTAAAAARETLEEACARVEVEGLYCFFDIPRINQVYAIFRARLLDPDFAPGAETLEARLFDETSIPWDEIAFPSIELALEHFFEDRRAGRFGLHRREITWRAGQPRPPAPRD